MLQCVKKSHPQLKVPPPVSATVSLLLPRASDPWGAGCGAPSPGEDTCPTPSSVR